LKNITIGGIMKLLINRKEENLNQEKISIIELLKVKDVKMPEMVSVQLNGNILKRNEFATTYLKNNDRIAFLYFMGGGENDS